ncbi:hypothetical protein C8Q76DRAFT_792978 [Earliella scabrosa]|nr:hypothetical protein C8Q76DRAFT_792978 [Earliella scabrosa]
MQHAAKDVTPALRRPPAGQGQKSDAVLQDFPNFAIEIQLQVFSYLHPRDLLNLVFTCRKFRTFFLHRTNEPLWKAVCANVGDLPTCPPFMSEPAYITVMYGSHCQNCGRAKASKAVWSWFARYCPTCISSLSYAYQEAQNRIIREALPSKFSEDWLDTMFAMYVISHCRRLYCASPVHRLLKTDVDSFVDKLRAMQASESDATLSSLIAGQKQCWKERYPYARACRRWLECQTAAKTAALEEKRSARYEEILRRLCALGWDKEINYLKHHGEYGAMDRTYGLPILRESGNLTPKVWSKILPMVDGPLQDVRRRRLDQERLNVIRPRLIALEEALLEYYVQLPRTPEMDLRPECADFAFMPECRALADAPDEQVVTKSDFAVLLPKLALRWSADRRTELIGALRTHFPEIPDTDDVDPLTLAVAVFPCRRCSRWGHFEPVPFFRYPEVLSHSCARIDSSGALDQQPRPVVPIYQRAMAFHSTKPYPFTLELMTDAAHFRKVANCMRKIVRALGLDPGRATVEELQACRPHLRCGVCARYGSDDTNLKTTWQAALHHAYMHIYPSVEP